MDVEMPMMNGLDTTRKIRELKNSEDIYIIGCSGHGDQAIQSCLESGMNDYLQKPIKIVKFIELVSSIIGMK
jgi:two-component system sensor histidine kinase BarA